MNVACPSFSCTVHTCRKDPLQSCISSIMHTIIIIVHKNVHVLLCVCTCNVDNYHVTKFVCSGRFLKNYFARLKAGK